MVSVSEQDCSYIRAKQLEFRIQSSTVEIFLAWVEHDRAHLSRSRSAEIYQFLVEIVKT